MKPPKPARLWPDSATILERTRGVFFAQWEELLRLRRAVLKTSSLDDIHDLRVASRRFRAALELFYPLAPNGHKTELRKQVRKLTRVLGGVRNIDEALLFFGSRVHTDFPPDSKLFGQLGGFRSREFKRIAKALRAFDHRNLDRVMRKMVAGLNGDAFKKRNSVSILACFSEASIQLYMPIHQSLDISTALEHRKPRHALRIAIKKWRYFFEIIGQVLDRDYAPFLELLKEYQPSFFLSR